MYTLVEAACLILAMAVAKTAVAINLTSWIAFTSNINLEEVVSPFGVSLLDWPCALAYIYCMLSAVRLGAQ